MMSLQVSQSCGFAIPRKTLANEASETHAKEDAQMKKSSATHDIPAREVKPPRDLVQALKVTPHGWDRWCELSRSHQQKHVETIEAAKKPETRARRIDKAVRTVASQGAKVPSSVGVAAKVSIRATPRLNATWHNGHRMPLNPSLAQRIAWHKEHEQQCGCRPVPAKLRALMASPSGAKPAK